MRKQMNDNSVLRSPKCFTTFGDDWLKCSESGEKFCKKFKRWNGNTD